MIMPNDDVYVDCRTSCRRDEAAAKMLGWMVGKVRLKHIGITAKGIRPEHLPHLHSFEGSLLELLQEQRELAQAAFLVANACGDTDDKLIELGEAVIDWDSLIDDAGKCLDAIDHEIAKGPLSAFREDPKATQEKGVPHYTMVSVDEWIQARKTIISEIQVSTPANDKPWWVVREGDPPAEQPWYTPARYFARQHIKESSTLSTNRPELAKKVSASLKSVGVYKRGGKEPPFPGSILKAFTKITF